nr:ubiquinol-cytochrome C chaperone family protein [Alphaproteobacteria bacterium]
MFKFIKKNALEQKYAENLYQRIVQQSRIKIFYTDFSIPDTIDGRYEVLVLHSWLFLKRLRTINQPSGLVQRVSQNIFDSLVRDFDISLRQIGLGDKKLATQVRFMVKGVYGRFHTYDQSFHHEDMLQQSLKRNILGLATVTVDQIIHLARYVLKMDTYLKDIEDQSFLQSDFM